MTLSQTERIYFVGSAVPGTEEGKSIECIADRQLEVHESDLASVRESPNRALRVFELETGDLAVTLSFLHDDKSQRTISYLVSYAVSGAGLLIPGDVVESKPKTWATPYLRHMIAELAPGEFEQFELPNLTAFAKSTS